MPKPLENLGMLKNLQQIKASIKITHQELQALKSMLDEPVAEKFFPLIKRHKQETIGGIDLNTLVSHLYAAIESLVIAQDLVLLYIIPKAKKQLNSLEFSELVLGDYPTDEELTKASEFTRAKAFYTRARNFPSLAQEALIKFNNLNVSSEMLTDKAAMEGLKAQIILAIKSVELVNKAYIRLEAKQPCLKETSLRLFNSQSTNTTIYTADTSNPNEKFPALKK